MTEQVAKNKSDIFSFLHKLNATKAQEAAIQAEKEEYIKNLTDNIKDAYLEWQNAMANFETAEGKEMVDYYAYRIKASEIRYAYLLKKAKQAKAQ